MFLPLLNFNLGNLCGLLICKHWWLQADILPGEAIYGIDGIIFALHDALDSNWYRLAKQVFEKAVQGRILRDF